jgi:hypothetical protein
MESLDVIQACSVRERKKTKELILFFFPHLQASVELAATYAALILADDGLEITVRPSRPLPFIHPC